MFGLLAIGCSDEPSRPGANGEPKVWKDSLSTDVDAPRFGASLPITNVLGSNFRALVRNGTLYAGAMTGTMERDRTYRVFRYEPKAWKELLSVTLDKKADTDVRGFAVSGESLFWVETRSSNKPSARVYVRKVDGTREAASPELPLKDGVAPVSERVDFDIDPKGRIYLGYYQNASPWRYVIYRLNGGEWTELSSASTLSVGLSKSPTDAVAALGFTLDGERLFVVGRDLATKDTPTVLEFDPESATWEKIFERPSLSGKGEIEFFSFDSRKGRQGFGALLRPKSSEQQFGGFYLRGPGKSTPWVPESEELIRDQGPHFRLLRLFAVDNGGLSVVTSRFRSSDATFCFWFKGGKVLFADSFALGTALGGSASTVVYDGRVLFFHQHPKNGFIASELAKVP
jgi:hypothetical protein